MRLSRVLQLVVLVAAPALVNQVAWAQFPLPKFPIGGKRKDTPRKGGNDGPAPAGVPVPADSPILQAFGKLEQQSVYHQRMTITAADPQVQQMMAQMGFAPAETITAGDTKQVSMHMQMPLGGKTEDMEILTVMRNGRLAKKWVSPGSARFVAEADAKIAKELAQQEEQAAKSIARSLSIGPMGLASAAVSGAAAAANVAVAGKLRKEVHDFFEWTCMDSAAAPPPGQHREAPPLTDLREAGDETLDGVAATSYEFYVHQDGKYQGPMRMSIAKDTGLPLRIGMSDPHMGGSMHMDYFGFNQGGDFEVPACLAK